jgi:hypothetical protein
MWCDLALQVPRQFSVANRPPRQKSPSRGKEPDSTRYVSRRFARGRQKMLSAERYRRYAINLVRVAQRAKRR